MKRFISTILLLLITATAISAQDIGDVYEDDYVYEQNGAGDQFIKINLDVLFPLNFEKQLYTGGAIELGYYRFLNSWLAVGGELNASYNISVGKKIYIMLPILAGVMFQPTYDKFEFPIFVNIGMGYETWQNIDYFPSLVMKLSGGAYYRLNEMCSFGLNLDYMLVPQFFEDSSKNFAGNFLSLTIGARYHF
ncbi:MAG: hypothetical protein MJ179_09085 [Treponema sp.]|nr:hypothetical protein [Treponema sp.]